MTLCFMLPVSFIDGELFGEIVDMAYQLKEKRT